MPDDLRIKLGWPNNLKRKRLQQKLGGDGVVALLDLWCYAGSNCTKGILGDVSADDLALMAGWKGDSKVFLQALLDGPWIEKSGKKLVLHGWEEHQPFLYLSEEISAKAREKAEKRWQIERAKSMPAACTQHTGGNTDGNAPSYHPTTLPPNHSKDAQQAPTKSQPMPESAAIYRQIFHLQLNVVQRDEIAKTVVGEEELSLWESILKAWAMKGWNPRNVEGMLDCFRKGGITNKDESGLNFTQRSVMESRRRRLERESHGKNGNGGTDDFQTDGGTAGQKAIAGSGGHLPGASERHPGRGAEEGCETVPADMQIFSDDSGDSGEG